MQFSEYMDSLEKLRNSSNAEIREKLNSKSFLELLNIYHLYDFDFLDICTMLQQTLIAIEAEQLMDDADAKGVILFFQGYLEHQYVGSGFYFVGGSLEIAASVDLETISTKMKNEHNIQTLKNARTLMKKIEGGYHTVYWILREIGNNFIHETNSVIHSLPENAQSFILHAFDEFKDDLNVQNFYTEFINTTKSESLKEEATDYLTSIK